ncbi:hypothetical protein GYMLUDRAFT_56864 [Collybiopsis luxurians FD-317 M1]|nr:hypothetical protein GYMLUDRAFT_56864 [Collybiopsis luxurians FD-317 M1]
MSNCKNASPEDALFAANQNSLQSSFQLPNPPKLLSQSPPIKSSHLLIHLTSKLEHISPKKKKKSVSLHPEPPTLEDDVSILACCCLAKDSTPVDALMLDSGSNSSILRSCQKENRKCKKDECQKQNACNFWDEWHSADGRLHEAQTIESAQDAITNLLAHLRGEPQGLSGGYKHLHIDFFIQRHMENGAHHQFKLQLHLDRLWILGCTYIKD